jgi:nucleoid-associated protein EbfC
MGMLDMVGKLNEFKKSVDEVKGRLESVYVEGHAGENTVTVVMNGNKIVSEIKIDARYLNEERKKELEDLLVLAVNRAQEKAQNTSEAELRAAGKGFLPNIPGMF